MILYNFRYRGPFEYEKFVLNTMQLYNESTNIINHEFDKGSDINKTLQYYIDNVNSIYNSTVNTSEELYLKLLNYERC